MSWAFVADPETVLAELQLRDQKKECLKLFNPAEIEAER